MPEDEKCRFKGIAIAGDDKYNIHISMAYGGSMILTGKPKKRAEQTTAGKEAGKAIEIMGMPFENDVDPS